MKTWALLGLILLALIGLYEEPEASRSAPYYLKFASASDTTGDTLFAGQADTTDAIRVESCVGVAIQASGVGSDSVLVTVQHSLDEQNWTAFGTAIALQNWGSFGILSRALTTVDVASSPTSQGNAASTRYVRLIVKNNCNTSPTQPDLDTLTTVTLGVTCGK